MKVGLGFRAHKGVYMWPRWMRVLIESNIERARDGKRGMAEMKV